MRTIRSVFPEGNVLRGRLKKGLHPSVVKHITEPYLYAARNELENHFYIHKVHVMMLKEQELLALDEMGRISHELSELGCEDIYSGNLDIGTDLYRTSKCS